MTEVLSLGSNGSTPDRPLVDVYGKAFRVRTITRSVQKALDGLDRDLREFLKDEDADGDGLISIYGRGLDAFLAPEGHRTTATKLIMAEWNADRLTLGQIREFADRLQELAVKRPT